MRAPRAYVFSTCARGAEIHGDVLNVYTVEGEGERVGGVVVSLVFFMGRTSVFLTFIEHLNRTLVSLLSQIFCFPKISHIGLSRASEVHR